MTKHLVIEPNPVQYMHVLPIVYSQGHLKGSDGYLSDKKVQTQHLHVY